MQFLLFDLSATLVFVFGYLTVVTLQHRRSAAPKDRSPRHEPRREWPRLSYPR